MSIIIFAALENHGKVVKRLQVPVGWDMPSSVEFRRNVISEVMHADKFLVGSLPEFTKVTVREENVSIDKDVFLPSFSIRNLLRQGVDREAVLSLAVGHRDALNDLDRTSYDLETNDEWADAVYAVGILINDLEAVS